MDKSDLLKLLLHKDMYVFPLNTACKRSSIEFGKRTRGLVYISSPSSSIKSKGEIPPIAARPPPDRNSMCWTGLPVSPPSNASVQPSSCCWDVYAGTAGPQLIFRKQQYRRKSEGRERTRGKKTFSIYGFVLTRGASSQVGLVKRNDF